MLHMSLLSLSVMVNYCEGEDLKMSQYVFKYHSAQICSDQAS